jgi:hypothetical protein
MNLAINYSKPAAALALKKHVKDPKLIPAYLTGLYMCWAQGICKAVEGLLREALDDPVINAARLVYETMDLDLAKRLYAWYLKCTGRKFFKYLMREDTGEVIAYDMSKLLPPPPDWPCPKDL